MNKTQEIPMVDKEACWEELKAMYKTLDEMYRLSLVRRHRPETSMSQLLVNIEKKHTKMVPVQ